MYDNCDVHIFWIGATEVESAVNLKKFIFREITQYIELDVCGVPLHPASAPRIGGQKYSKIVLHHLTIRQFATIVEHLTDLFLGVVGSYHNAWSQAPGCYKSEERVKAEPMQNS